MSFSRCPKLIAARIEYTVASVRRPSTGDAVAIALVYSATKIARPNADRRCSYPDNAPIRYTPLTLCFRITWEWRGPCTIGALLMPLRALPVIVPLFALAAFAQ